MDFFMCVRKYRSIRYVSALILNHMNVKIDRSSILTTSALDLFHSSFADDDDDDSNNDTHRSIFSTNIVSSCSATDRE